MPRFCVNNNLMTCVAAVLILVLSINYSESAPKSSPYNIQPFSSVPPYPSYPAGPPNMLNQGSDSIPISSGMFRDFLPHFSSMDYGFLYEFSSKGYKRSQFFSNLFLPLIETCRNVWFCQAHYGYNGFSSASTYESGSASYRADLSVGGGYRFFLDDPFITVLGGFNGFWDTSRIYGSWWNSWGVGLEMAVGIPVSGLFDFTVNQYGNQFQNMENVADIWRKGDFNFDLEVGYSQGLFDGLIDVRWKYNTYQFSLGDNQTISGSKGGAELTTGDGFLKIGWEIGYDRDKETYNSVLASVNIGFQPESLLRGQNPFSMPHSIFMSPERNPRRILTQKVRRNTNLPDKVVTAKRNAPVPSGPHFVVTFSESYFYGSGTYTQASNTNGTYTIAYYNLGGNLICRALSYTVSLVGNTTGITFPLTATITPNATQPTGVFNVRQAGGLNQPETVTFINEGDLVKTVPPDGNSGPPIAGGRPTIGRIYGSGSAGSQGTIVITAPGVQTLTIDVNEPTPVAFFRVTMNAPYGFGSGSYTQPSNTNGTWTITPAIDGANYHTIASSYTVSLVGDTTGLTFPLTATITPSATQPTGQFTVSQSGVVSQPETITFANSSDLVKTIPPNGNSVGAVAVPNVIRQRGSGSAGNQGNITIAATGVQTLTVAVVSANEPTPGVVFFQVTMNGTYGFGSGSYTQPSNTNGTWTITPGIDGANYHTRASSYTVTLSGDMSGLIFPLTATITPNATQLTGHFTVQQSGLPDLPETITFANLSDLIKTIPPNGNSVGTNAVPDVIRQRDSGSAGNQGNITIAATGVQTLTIAVVSNEPVPVAPHFELAVNDPYLGGSDGRYEKYSDTSGTWTIITYAPDPGPEGYKCVATSYTIRLVGTTGVIFPLQVTITPNQVPFPPPDYHYPPNYLTLRLRAQDGAGQNDVPETVWMYSTDIGSDDTIVKMIGPGGQGDHSGTRNIPDIYWTGSSPVTTGGNFTISAPVGSVIPNLVVDLVKAP